MRPAPCNSRRAADGFAFLTAVFSALTRRAFITAARCFMLSRYCPSPCLSCRRSSALSAPFRKKHLSRREEFLVMAAFVVPPVICSVFQIVFQTIPILSVGIVISFQLACINFLERKISQDSLTGISNRREILRLTGEKMRLKKGKRKSLVPFLSTWTISSI